MNYPLISLIVPCYNYAHFLPETLESALQQTYTNWECIVVNDGSTDNTSTIAKEICKSDSRFKYIEKENGGLSSARNAGLKAAKGEFIQFLDADDLILPDKFALQLREFELDPGIDISYTDFSYFDNSGNIFNSHFDRVQLKGDPLNDFILNWGFEFVIPIHCPLFRAKFFKEKKIWFQEEVKAREDWIMWIEIASLTPKFEFINQKLAFYRKHPSSMVFDPVFMIKNTFIACLLVYEKIPENLTEKFRIRYSDYFSMPLGEKIKQYNELKNKWYFKCINKIKKIFAKS